MSNELTVKQKDKAAQTINKKYAEITDTHKLLIKKCINLGEFLTKTKAELGHGNWEDFLSNRNSEFRFDARQARKFMQISSNKELSLEFLNGENTPTSINELTNRISNATEEEKEAAEKSKQYAIDEIERKRLEKEKKDSEKVEDVIEGDFIEVKEEPAKTPKKELVEDGMIQVNEDDLDALVESNSEMKSYNKSLLDENIAMTKVFEADDKLNEASNEINKLLELSNMLQGRVDSLMTSGAEKEKTLKYWRSRSQKFEKKLKEIEDARIKT